MIYKVYVIGENPTSLLRPFLAEGNRFVIDLPLRRLCGEDGLSWSSDRILKEIKDLVEFQGKVAIVTNHNIDSTCRKLYEAGVSDFMVLSDDDILTVKRLLERKPEAVEQLVEEDHKAPVPKFFDFTLAQDGLGTGFISSKGEGTFGSMKAGDIDFKKMVDKVVAYEHARHGNVLDHLDENRDEEGANKNEGFFLDKAWRDLLPHAILTSKGWLERGELGWLGTVTNAMSWEDWRKEVACVLLDTPKDAKVTIAFCEK